MSIKHVRENKRNILLIYIEMPRSRSLRALVNTFIYIYCRVLQETLMGIHKVLYDDSNAMKQVVLVMDYMVHGSLADRILEVKDSGEYLEEDICKLVAFQLLMALDFLFFKKIMHRDVKPDNVLIVSSSSEFIRIKLTDFGLAKIISNTERATSQVGSRGFTAPEVEYRQLGDKPYTFKADVWSFGATMAMW